MIIGIIKEIMEGEQRVSAIPETVKKFIDLNCTVFVEKDAGKGSHYSNEDYAAAGAEIVDDCAEVFNRADLILKVKEPQFNNAKNLHEVEMMKKGQYLMTFLHPAAPANRKMIQDLAEKGVISLTLDAIPRISRAQSMDALTSMSTCAGYKGRLMAATHLAKFMPLIGSAVGMVKPANVFVIGTGVSGLRAMATAKGLGASVYSADIRPEANQEAKSLGAKIVETGIPVEIAVSADGKHANALSEEWLAVLRKNIAEAVKNADIVFCSALVLGKIAPVILTDEMVQTMKPGSCIVDISIDQGGNCAITTPGKTDVKHDVIIIGIKNIPGMIPTSSTWLFANNIFNLAKYIMSDGKIVLDMNDEVVSSILVTNEGKVTPNFAFP
jgi:NAD(P) transhydrogenase subunit alpha